MSHREFKDRLYGQFARLGRALASPYRLELLDLLAQGERTVESLAEETGATTANISQHLQILRNAGLAAARKDGLYVHYRIADPTVLPLCAAVRTVAEKQDAELHRIVRDHFGERSEPEPVEMEELLRRVRSGGVIVVDARPAAEYAAGHIPGALSIPVNDLKQRLQKLPKSKPYVAYCRGPYCIYADQAVEQLRATGRRARRLAVGLPEWKAAGLPVEIGAEPGGGAARS
jgi:rhodanese-related sulfurtransferase/DNA-binding transcriptional ArsR family regulator